MAKVADAKVPSRKKRYVEKPDVRAKFLDAAEQLIREEGYAAASARAIAERVGMKHQAVFYYFNSQDELLLEVYRRTSRLHRERLEVAFRSANPVRGIWEIARDPATTAITIEFMALANHNELIRAEIAKTSTEIRNLESAAIDAYFKKLGINPLIPPEIVSILTNACARLLVQESTLGIHVGHKMYEDQVEESFRTFESSGETSNSVQAIVDSFSPAR